MCYLVKFGSAASKGVRINRRDHQIGERWSPAPLGWGRGWAPRNTPLPRLCYPAEFGRSMLNDANVIKEIRLKKMILAFQGHSRSSESQG